MYTVFGEKRRFERTVIIRVQTTPRCVTGRFVKTHPVIGYHISGQFQNKIVLLWRQKPYFFRIEKYFMIVSKMRDTFLSTHVYLKQKQDILSVHVLLLFQISVDIFSQFWSIF